jgi:hypothetical protein
MLEVPCPHLERQPRASAAAARAYGEALAGDILETRSYGGIVDCSRPSW